MKLGKGVPSVWPGYVAAIASLVLSLLLLLAILVFAMAQVESLVAKYSKQIMRDVLQEELDSSGPVASEGARPVAQTTGGRAAPSRPSLEQAPAPSTAVTARASELASAGMTAAKGLESIAMEASQATARMEAPAPTPAPPKGLTRDIRLVFEAGAYELNAVDANEIKDAIRRAGRPADTRWLISSVVQESDPVGERLTYRLMSQVHKSLIGSGMAQGQLDMRLRKTTIAPPGREREEVIVYIVPQSSGAERGVR